MGSVLLKRSKDALQRAFFFFVKKLSALKKHSFRTTQHNPLRNEMAQYNRKDMRGFSEKKPFIFHEEVTSFH